MANGQLSKMTVTSFPDNSFSGKGTACYEVLVNPENYTITYEIIKSRQATQGLESDVWTFNHVPSQSLTFKFLFDGTGVIQSASGPGGISVTPSVLGSINKRDVAKDIDDFKKIVYGYNGTVHQPQYLQLKWGPLHYNCSLQTMTVTFKLFNPDGSPLRAEAECTFISEMSAAEIVQKQNNQSPDLTHIRTVKKGDTLPLLCFREYGDSKYYYEVAKVNRLTNFKTLIPGTKLILPPFRK